MLAIPPTCDATRFEDELRLAPHAQREEAVAAAGERMPPKSTYFYPKALSGLAINPLD